MWNRKNIDVIIAEKEYWNKLPNALKTIPDTGNRDEISRIVYENIDRYDYDNYSLNQVLFYDSKEDETGNNDFYIPDIKHNDSSADFAVIVKELMQCLIPVEREVIERYFYNDESFRVIAEKLNISKSTVGNIKDRALEKMSEINVYSKNIHYYSSNTNAYLRDCGMSGISEYSTNECPCKLMSYLRGSFGDDKTICPGSYTDDGRRLLCAKKVTLFIADVPDELLTIKEAAVVLGLPQSKVEQYRDTKRLPTTHEPLSRNRRIIGSQIADCGNEVYHYGEIRTDKEKYKFDTEKYRKYLSGIKFEFLLDKSGNS